MARPPAILPSDMIVPDRLVMVTDLGANTQRAAVLAVQQARLLMPKLTGWAAHRLTPVWGEGWFGIMFLDPYVWWLEAGTRPRTMRNLAGKTIPMWLDDPTGKIRSENPKNKTRTTASGKVQVLMFRRATKIGQRKIVTRKVGGRNVKVSVPTAYPGAPGRIANREASAPWTSVGRVGGRIIRGNVGVRWYNPGLTARYTLLYAITQTAERLGLPINTPYPSVG